jgi:poly(beta-D-mannuronate) lyase
MNGVPNSPANRYVAVTDAVIANNSFIDCTPMSFCEGSDTERSVPPKNVQFINNIIDNQRDSRIYYIFDSISGIHFSGNLINKSIKQNTTGGFIRSDLQRINAGIASIPFANKNPKSDSFDSLYKESLSRVTTRISLHPGFSDLDQFKKIEKNALAQCGAAWFNYQKKPAIGKQINVTCKTAEDIVSCLSKNSHGKLNIILTGREYTFSAPFLLHTDISFTSTQKGFIRFVSKSRNGSFLFQVAAGKSLSLNNLKLDLSGINNFITTDTSGSCNHSSFSFTGCQFSNMHGTFFTAAKSSVSDSILVNKCVFNIAMGKLFDFSNEIDKKGYYNVEKLKMTNNTFRSCKDQLLTMLRGGNDESTMGPYLIFSGNMIDNCVTAGHVPLISLSGTQRSEIENNNFKDCNPGNPLIQYIDWVRAVHGFSNNILNRSGKILTDKFVTERNNIIQ